MSMHVAIIGCGGLGGPIAYALAAAGADLTLCDDDAVELSNLQRQVQFTTADLGRGKADALAAELVRRGHTARVRALPRRFDADTAAEILAPPTSSIDLAIDASDDPPTKFAVADAAVARGLPYVVASVLRYTGQVFAGRPGDGGCYRCLFEAPPADAPTCGDAGVLGAACAIVGGHAARAALALAAGEPGGRLHVFDDLRRGAAPREVTFRPRPGCATCAPPHAIEEATCPAS